MRETQNLLIAVGRYLNILDQYVMNPNRLPKKNLPHQPLHLVCTDCDEIIKETFAQYGKILCSICPTPVRALSLLRTVRYMPQNYKKVDRVIPELIISQVIET